MKLTQQSALDLPLKGTVGSFKVGAQNNNASIEVKYLLTHVGLNFAEGTDEKLLRELAPVREIFDFKNLDFDEIMQRDIDDARVSSELIPYILDDTSSQLVKFFPPIVVVALPIEENGVSPSSYYPEVSIDKDKLENDNSGAESWLVTQSGEIGGEVFRFEQPVSNNVVNLHDLVSLKLNTSKTRLVIVDGQHRAMALLALYRNLKDGWSDAKRKPFESYYREWTPDFIRSFNLKEIKLPMIICTFPELDTKYEKSGGEYDLKKASRSIFLTLNKNARKVSRSRNLLLDDSDLISSFMRKILSKVKNGDRDFTASHSFEIHNVELDQSSDRQVITSPMAFTGVSHIYYLIEHLLLNSGDVDGVKKREGRFSTRTTGQYFTGALDRLDADELIGTDVFQSVSRNIFTKTEEELLSNSFISKYGMNILKAFTNFGAYDHFSKTTQDIKNRTEQHGDVHIKPMLFDGQGIARVFEDHRASLDLRLKEGAFKHDVPKIESFKNKLDKTSENYNQQVDYFYTLLTERFFSSLPKKDLMVKSGDKDVLSDKAIEYVRKIYRDIFSSIAFQSALICGFYNEFEKFSNGFDGSLDIDVEAEFANYIQCLNNFFIPKTFSKWKAISSLFFGETDGDSFDSIDIVPGSGATFRSVVYPGEMTPDEWPKYRYLLLELWSSENEEFDAALENEKVYCRKQIIIAHFKRKVNDYCKEHAKHHEELLKEEKSELFNKSYTEFSGMLKYLGKFDVLDKKELRQLLLS